MSREDEEGFLYDALYIARRARRRLARMTEATADYGAEYRSWEVAVMRARDHFRALSERGIAVPALLSEMMRSEVL